MSNLLAQFSSKEYELLNEDLPREELSMIEDCEWRLAFDGSSVKREDGARIVSYPSDGIDVSLSFKLGFLCQNNEAEYGTLVRRFIFTFTNRNSKIMCLRRFQAHN